MSQRGFGKNYGSGFILNLSSHCVHRLAEMQLQPDCVAGRKEVYPLGREGRDQFEQPNFHTVFAPKQDAFIGCWNQKIPNSETAGQPPEERPFFAPSADDQLSLEVRASDADSIETIIFANR